VRRTRGSRLVLEGKVGLRVLVMVVRVLAVMVLLTVLTELILQMVERGILGEGWIPVMGVEGHEVLCGLCESLAAASLGELVPFWLWRVYGGQEGLKGVGLGVCEESHESRVTVRSYIGAARDIVTD
jgi:hypothetical protein